MQYKKAGNKDEGVNWRVKCELIVREKGLGYRKVQDSSHLNTLAHFSAFDLEGKRQASSKAVLLMLSSPAIAQI